MGVLAFTALVRIGRPIGYSGLSGSRGGVIEQDHRGVKSRTRPMLGFKNFKSAAITIAGVELLRCIHKNQFALNRLLLNGKAAPEIWNAVLAA